MSDITARERLAFLCFSCVFFTGQFNLFPVLFNYAFLIVFIFIALIWLAFNFRSCHFSMFAFLLVIYLFACIIFAFIYNKPISFYYHYILSLISIIALSSISFRNIRNAFKKYISVISYFALASLLNTFIYIFLGTSFIFLGSVNADLIAFYGVEFPRFSSFVSEPSAMMPFFLLPSLYYICLNGFSKRSFFVFVMIFLSFAGTFVIILFIASITLFLTYLLKNRSSSLKILHYLILPSLIVCFFYYLIYEYNRDSIVQFLTFGDSISKGTSAIIRFENLILLFERFSDFKWGSSIIIDVPVGFFLSSYLSGGLLLTLISLLIYYFIIRYSLSYSINNLTLIQSFSLFLIISSFTVFFVFNDYGFSEYCGFIMLYFFIRLVDSSRYKRLNPSASFPEVK